MIFNDNHLCECFIVNDIRRHILPPQDLTLKRIPGRRGARFIKKRHGVGTIEVDITVIDHDATDYRTRIRHIASLLDTEKPEKLIFTDEPDKFYMAILDGDTDLDEIMMIGEGTLKFTCPDPIAYGKLIKTPIISSGKLYNNGTYPSSGIITIKITRDVTNLKVTLQNTGEFIFIEDSLKTGDIVEINLEDEYVKKNGNLIKVHLESDFFDLPIGEFNLTTSSGTMEIEFRERWL